MAALEEREDLDEEAYYDAIALEMIQDKFFEPWGESDLILVVEERKLHVHRLILKIASPVFNNMLTGNFKEKDASEIILPEKDMYHFIMFLRQIYPQYTDEVHIYNCEYLYKLADEYQIDSLKQSCLNVIETTEITKDNVFTMFKVSKLCNKEYIHKKCTKALCQLTVSEIFNQNKYNKLEEDDLLSVMSSKARKLEECLKSVLPEFVGLLDCALYFWFENGKHNKESSFTPTRCPAHYLHGKASKNASIEDRVKCDACRIMFLEMPMKLLRESETDEETYVHLYSNSGIYFNHIAASLKEMYSLLQSDVTRTS